MNRVAVIGAGAWGTALAIQAARAGNAVTLWVRDPARAREIALARESPRLPGARLAEAICVAAEMPDAADAVLLAVPMQRLRAVAGLLPRAHVPLVACAKGVEQDTLRLPLEVLEELHPGRPAAVLTGPNFAREIAAGKPAATVVAAPDPALRARLADLLGTPGFRIYGNDDPVGAQIGGAAKNVVAIAAGAVIGAGLGENARAGLITRGLAELGRLAVALGGRAETVMGLSGLGDLLLTCTSAASRNFSLGLALGRGEALGAVLAARSAVTEGVATAPALVARAGATELPICRAVADLLAGRLDLASAIRALLARPRRDE
jgi:glycerol-3-phosphate dehydrogenase (NAD(P)+)